jgi:hypothetical protein
MTSVAAAFDYRTIVSPNLVGVLLNNAVEPTAVTSVAATGTIIYEINAQSVVYSTANATANWTLNIVYSKAFPLNAYLSIGQSVTIAHMVTTGATAYYNNVLQIDGVTVTPKYQGGTAYAAGNASSIDVYTYTITKTANRTYTVFTSQTKFA